MKVLAVDPGQKRIGIAVSDPTGSLARPLTVLAHVSRSVDAAKIAALADEQSAEVVIIGQSLDDEGQLTFQGRGATLLADAVRELTSQPVELWDEAFSTQDAFQTRLAAGVRRSKRAGHLDDHAAAVILQSYLDAHDPRSSG